MSTKSNSSSKSRKSSNASSDNEKTSTANLNSTESQEGPFARLCHLKKWPHFQGYGFNLHAERSKLGQHIGKVDVDSPSDAAGLKEGDRIIEVNNVNISNENHQQVVKRIRNGLDVDGVQYPDQVILLVVDVKADEYYKKLNLVPKNDMKNIIKLVTPDAQPSKSSEILKDADSPNENEITNKVSNISTTQTTKSSVIDERNNSAVSIEKNRRNSNTSNSSETSSKITNTNKSTNKLNSSISSSSNTSNNASVIKTSNVSSSNVVSKESTIENQANKIDNRSIGHKENSSPSTPVSSNNYKVIFTLVFF